MLTYKTLGDAPRGFSLFFICFVALVIYNKLNMEKNIPSISTLRISFLSGATEKICHCERKCGNLAEAKCQTLMRSYRNYSSLIIIN